MKRDDHLEEHPFVKGSRLIFYIDGRAIRRARVASGLGLREAASQLGLSNSYYCRIENGHRNSMTHELLGKMIDLFGDNSSRVREP